MNVLLPLDGTQRTRVRSASRTVFGGQYVLEALLIMAGTDAFYAGDIVEATRCEGSYVSGLLKKLAAEGLIQAVPKPPGQTRLYYRRRPSVLWSLVQTWAEELTQSADSSRVTVLGADRVA
jgi:hypothetical protein